MYLYNADYSLILNGKIVSQFLSQAVTVDLLPPLKQCRLLKIKSFREIELCDIANKYALLHVGGASMPSAGPSEVQGPSLSCTA